MWSPVSRAIVEHLKPEGTMMQMNNKAESLMFRRLFDDEQMKHLSKHLNKWH